MRWRSFGVSPRNGSPPDDKQVARAILDTARARDSELILIDGYGNRPLLEAVLGGTVDQVLRESDRPVLICR
jgi:nucleotide-binding universal stress UspA family protein